MFTEDVNALRELKAEFRSQERWAEFAQVLERWISSVDDPERRTLLEDELIETYEFMLQLDDPATVLDAELKLDELYRQRATPDAYQALANLYLDCAERNSDDIEAYVAARRACAAVFETDLKQPEAALIVMLSALGSDVLKQSGVVPEIQRLAERTGKWADAAAAVDEILHQQAHDAEWAALKITVGDWWSHVDLDAARLCYELAFETDPTDMAAIERLERIFKNAMDVSGHARLLRARAEATADLVAKSNLLCEAAERYEQLIDHASQAIDCYERSISIHPQERALGSLERLYSAAQRWEDLVRVLKVRELATDDIAELNALQRRIADMLARAGAVDEAIQQFRDSASSPKEFIEILKREAESVESPHNRGRFLAEVGNVFAHELNDNLSAHHYYQKALTVDSQIVDAAEPLADVFISEGRWDRAAPLLEAVLRNATPERPPSWRHMRWLQFARACQRTARPAEALEAYRNAYEFNPRDVATLKGFGKALLDAQEWESSFRILATLLDHHKSTLDPQAITAMFYMRGLCLENMGDIDRSMMEYEETVRSNPRHRDALQKLTTYYEEKANWAKFVQFANDLINVEPEPLVRFRQFVRLGEVWANELNRPDLAMQSYRGAIDIDANSLVVLRRLLDIYTRQNKFQLAVKVIERLLAQESNPKRKANLHYTAGVIYRDHVGNAPESVRHFEAALDSDWEMLKAFEGIDRLLTQAREWKALERSYRKMLQRISTAPDPEDIAHIERLLWEGLAEIYRSRLGEYDNAIEAYLALRLRRPNDEKITLILTELYEQVGNADGAIAEHRKLIAEDAQRVDSYHALYSVYSATGNWDAAWCVSGALSFMRCANAHEESFYQKYLGRNLKLAHGVVTPDMLRHLYHPSEDVLTSMILSYVSESLRPIYGNTLKGLGVHKKQTIPADAKDVFRRIYDYVSRTLGNPASPALFKSDKAVGLKNLNAEWPAVLAGTDRLQTSNDRENAFLAGKLLCGMRPDHYLATTGFSAQAIYTLFMAALEAMEPSLKVSKQIRDSNFSKAVKELRNLPDASRVQLKKVVHQFLQRGTPVDIEAWLVAVDHTTSRFGLLVCGDLALAGATVRYGPMQMGPGTDEAKLRELTLFAISDSHFELRSALRLSISDTSSPWS